MARQLIDNGGFADDPNADNLYTAFTKHNNNEGALWKLFMLGEHLSDGTLVYPTNVTQTVSYNTDSTIDELTCSYDSKTWTLAFQYNADDNVDLLTADDGTNYWTKAFTYNADGSINTEGGWVAI